MNAGGGIERNLNHWGKLGGFGGFFCLSKIPFNFFNFLKLWKGGGKRRKPQISLKLIVVGFWRFFLFGWEEGCMGLVFGWQLCNLLCMWGGGFAPLPGGAPKPSSAARYRR